MNLWTVTVIKTFIHIRKRKEVGFFPLQEPSTLPSGDLLPSWLHQNPWLFWVHDLYSLSSLQLLTALLFSTWNPADFPPQGCFLEYSKSKTVKIKEERWLFFSLQNNKLSLGGFKTSLFTTQNTSGSKQAEMVSSKAKSRTSKQGQKNLEKSKLQWDWGGVNPLRPDHYSHIGEAAEMKSPFFFPQYLYVQTIF